MAPERRAEFASVFLQLFKNARKFFQVALSEPECSPFAGVSLIEGAFPFARRDCGCYFSIRTQLKEVKSMRVNVLSAMVSAVSLCSSIGAFARDDVPQNFIVMFERGAEHACVQHLQALNPELVPVRTGFSYSIYSLTEAQAAAVAQMRCVKVIEVDQAIHPL